jgi:peptidoglycan/LPS O-acetylase OafA/YrhL
MFYQSARGIQCFKRFLLARLGFAFYPRLKSRASQERRSVCSSQTSQFNELHAEARDSVGQYSNLVQLPVMPDKSIYYPAFDYLRIILATVVAVGHSGISVWGPSGGYSVQVFFALSGWLIGNILLGERPADLPRFYFNRAARIWIPYLVAVLLLMAASLMKEQVTVLWTKVFFYDLTFVYNFFGAAQVAELADQMPLRATGNHFWSICAEEQFYLVAPLLIAMIGSIGRRVLLWSVICALALVSPYWSYFGAISLGVLAAVTRNYVGDWQEHRIARFVLFVAASVMFAMTCLETLTFRIGAPVSSILIVLLLAQSGNYSKIGAFLGGISFPMYLNHWIGVFVANAAFGKFGLRDTFVCHLTGVALALLLAALLYITIDRNVRNNRSRYFNARRGKSAAALGFSLVTIGALGGLTFGIAPGKP